MSNYTPRSVDEIAKRVAQDIEEGMYVNLGIGQPTKVADFLPKDKDIFLHSENGVLGMGPAPEEADRDGDLINAGKQHITLLKGGSYFHHGDSFAMICGGHIDLCVLGAFEVAKNGDIANWFLGRPKDIPAVGGAMDLAVGAKKVYVIMDHVSKNGEPKIVENLNLPITGEKCVNRIYTNLAVIDITEQGLVVRDMVEGLTFDELQSKTGATLQQL
ncbi:3-oxoacid CoA-transferase subunit B [Psychrobacter sp. APC 3281]|uniref:3-oxoacid CoA-transferase subunit B n=1 Tax=Psychrobacter sp. APC 3281 TaxID=3035190 RepID=UPI0025B2C60F|nr:3-oxoacid CoA-transferase subunit B [Psychrobacter sp. APC 3281]MDN3448513.1 3-oxoacid CoA-transferase subunit B [Psychrobacter sp. APC 3281]